MVNEEEFALDATSREALEEAIQINESEMARLKAALDKRRARDEHLKRLAAMWTDSQRHALDHTATIPDDFAKRQRQRRTSTAWLVRREAYLVLKRVQRPLNRTELLKELRKAGVEVKGTDPLALITKIMWNASEFISTGNGYWLAEDDTSRPDKFY
ncbi:hypothetical protein [Rhizobium ruizarguesonis]|uniref:hypothetical protein n=1 Tax=Rhizobium ruizarguesonis TaxID=2081791 RepID=UPI0013EE4633|nr:hypothetical protein [Rhizobium ruizarguesonis]